MSHKTLTAIMIVAICPLCWAVELPAQQEDDKRLEITSYLGTLHRFYAPCVGLGLEYFTSPRVSVDVEINYLPHIAFVNTPTTQRLPWGLAEIFFMTEENYRLMGDINLLIYLNLSEMKRGVGLYFTVGTGFQYDSEEHIVVHLKTLEQYKYVHRQLHFQNLTFGVGYKLYIKDDWALRILYKIHMPYIDLITGRLALGLSYRF